jgi:hypothetical protein
VPAHRVTRRVRPGDAPQLPGGRAKAADAGGAASPSPRDRAPVRRVNVALCRRPPHDATVGRRANAPLTSDNEIPLQAWAAASSTAR